MRSQAQASTSTAPDPSAVACLRHILDFLEDATGLPLTELWGNFPARKKAESLGVKLYWQRGELHLLIATDNGCLAARFAERGLPWAGYQTVRGGGTVRCWTLALRALPRAQAHGPVRFCGKAFRNTRIPISTVEALTDGA